MNKSEIEARINELKEEIKRLESKLKEIKTGVFIGCWGNNLRILVVDECSAYVFQLCGEPALPPGVPEWLDSTTLLVNSFTYTNIERITVPESLKRLIKANEA